MISLILIDNRKIKINEGFSINICLVRKYQKYNMRFLKILDFHLSFIRTMFAFFVYFSDAIYIFPSSSRDMWKTFQISDWTRERKRDVSRRSNDGSYPLVRLVCLLERELSFTLNYVWQNETTSCFRFTYTFHCRHISIRMFLLTDDYGALSSLCSRDSGTREF